MHHYLFILIVLSGITSSTQAQVFPFNSGFGSQQIISAQTQFAMAVYATDLDGDGDDDVLSASFSDDKIAWYENEGNGIFGPQQIITNQADGANDVYAIDLDGDGDQDVVSSSQYDNLISWYVNEGGGNFGARRVYIGQLDLARSVHATDLDGDGDADVLSTSMNDDEIVWFANDGQGSFGSAQIISTLAIHPMDVYATDLDGDGDEDVLSASLDDNKVAWYENDGHGNFGAQQIITTQADFANSIYTADLDGDGDVDVLSASNGDQKIAWYENDGLGNFGAQQIINDQANYAQAVYATDLDGDGDQDVLGTTQGGNGVYWYANDGLGNFAAARLITKRTETVYDIHTADLDGDGDQDVLSASYDDKVAWYENQIRPEIASFLLINATADRIVRPLAEGDVIDVSALGLERFSVRAVGGNSVPKTVRFDLSGPITRNRYDLNTPFTLFGENGSDFYGEEPLTGDYTLTATPFRYGMVGPSKTINFRLVPSLVESFTLINADDDQDLMPLEDGAVIDPAVFGTSGFNVRANVEETVVRVEFEYSGPISGTQTENVAPYALFGDVSGDYNGEVPLSGDYTITATPYTSLNDGSLVAGSPVELHFTIADPSVSALHRSAARRNAARMYPNSFGKEFWMQTDKATEQLHIQFYPVQGGVPYTVPAHRISREGVGWHIATPDLPAGQYILRVIGADWVETLHVIKE